MSNEGTSTSGQDHDPERLKKICKRVSISYLLLICPAVYMGFMSGMVFDSGPPYELSSYLAFYSCLGLGPMMFLSLILALPFYLNKRYRIALSLMLLPSLNIIIGLFADAISRIGR